jgi:hypothetical protein
MIFSTQPTLGLSWMHRDRSRRKTDRNIKVGAMHMRRIFVRLATAAAAVVVVAIAAGEPGADAKIKFHHRVSVFDSCPFIAAGGGALLFEAAAAAPLRPDSGFECPINQLPSSS